MSAPHKRLIRRRLIAGMIAIAPITVTAAVLWWIFVTVDGLLGQFLYPVLPFPIPGLGLISLLIILFLVGWAAERAIGSRVADGWHSLLERIPVTRRIYGAANRIVRTVFAEESRPFKTVVLFEYPSPGRWAVGFLAGAAPQAIRASVPDAVTVFMPTTPNPTTGFLIVLPRAQVRELAMSVDQAFTYILSAGAATPEELRAAGEAAPPVPARMPADAAGDRVPPGPALPVGAPTDAP